MSFKQSLYVERLSHSSSFRNDINFAFGHKLFYLIFDSYWYLRAVKNIRYILIHPTFRFYSLYRMVRKFNMTLSIKNIIISLQLYNIRRHILNKKISVVYIDYENQKIDKMLIELLRDLDICIIGFQRFLINRSDFPHILPLTIMQERFRPDKIFCEGPDDYVNCLNHSLSEDLFFKLEAIESKKEISDFRSDTLHVYIILGPYLTHVDKILRHLENYDKNSCIELLIHPLNNSKAVLKLFEVFKPKIKHDRSKFNSKSIILSEANSFLINLDGKCQKILLFGTETDQCYKNLFKITKPVYVA
jgi:hypothetical protein